VQSSGSRSRVIDRAGSSGRARAAERRDRDRQRPRAERTNDRVVDRRGVAFFESDQTSAKRLGWRDESRRQKATRASRSPRLALDPRRGRTPSSRDERTSRRTRPPNRRHICVLRTAAHGRGAQPDESGAGTRARQLLFPIGHKTVCSKEFRDIERSGRSHPRRFGHPTPAAVARRASASRSLWTEFSPAPDRSTARARESPASRDRRARCGSTCREYNEWARARRAPLSQGRDRPRTDARVPWRALPKASRTSRSTAPRQKRSGERALRPSGRSAQSTSHPWPYGGRRIEVRRQATRTWDQYA